jgi:hypothetical protein
MRGLVAALGLLMAAPASAAPVAIDARIGFGTTTAIAAERQGIVSLGLDGHLELRSGLVLGLTADLASSGRDDDTSHAHLGALLGVSQRRGSLRGLLLAEAGVHGIGGVGDSPSTDAETVRLGYLGVRVGLELLSQNIPVGIGTSISLRRDLADQVGWLRGGGLGFVEIPVGGTELVWSCHVGLRF